MQDSMDLIRIPNGSKSGQSLLGRCLASSGLTFPIRTRVGGVARAAESYRVLINHHFFFFSFLFVHYCALNKE